MKHITYGELLDLLINLPEEELAKKVIIEYLVEPDHVPSLIAFRRIIGFDKTPSRSDFQCLSLKLEKYDAQVISLRQS